MNRRSVEADTIITGDGLASMVHAGDIGHTRVKAKRGYSRAFKPHGETGKRYLLDKIPAGLWAAVKVKAKRDGVSMRALILKLLTDWLTSAARKA